jgi:hypothetical protein
VCSRNAIGESKVPLERSVDPGFAYGETITIGRRMPRNLILGWLYLRDEATTREL